VPSTPLKNTNEIWQARFQTLMNINCERTAKTDNNKNEKNETGAPAFEEKINQQNRV
jgi:hypothetical protein